MAGTEMSLIAACFVCEMLLLYSDMGATVALLHSRKAEVQYIWGREGNVHMAVLLESSNGVSL